MRVLLSSCARDDRLRDHFGDSRVVRADECSCSRSDEVRGARQRAADAGVVHLALALNTAAGPAVATEVPMKRSLWPSRVFWLHFHFSWYGWSSNAF